MCVTLDRSLDKPLLQTGSTDVRVIEIQKLLAHWNLYAGAVDGIFGEQLEQAVKVFQRRVFLPETGTVDALTWRSLYAGAPIEMPVLQRGSTDQSVILLQKALQASGQTVALNGIFDHQTEVAVQQFQRRQGLVVDGVVAACTWLTLSKISR
ncbi:MAG: peptidoglycan-binding protein [Lyngbya sp. HA4199-MV5]|jgi:peptidoglycan hydrolase-like protein with peptidoglycan-binding domain|nr:peptidoglycan-binding protein [Lyngbya sp. HA4199-MV5]